MQLIKLSPEQKKKCAECGQPAEIAFSLGKSRGSACKNVPICRNCAWDLMEFLDITTHAEIPERLEITRS